MPYNGVGTFVSMAPPDYPAVSGELIKASQHNNNMVDVFGGLTNAVTRDGQSPPTANLPMGGKRFTNAGDAVLVQEYLTKRQVSGTIAGEGADLSGFGALAAYARATVGYRLGLDRIIVTDSPFSADPTNTSDSSVAIQAAIDSVAPYTTAFALFTKEIYIPIGKYKLNASILHRNGVIINMERGAELYVTGNFPAITQSPNTSTLGLRAYSSLGLKGINIVGTNGTTNNAGAGLLNGNLASQHGIYLSNTDTYNSASYLYVENTFIYNVGGHGIYNFKPAVSNTQFGWTQFGHLSDVTVQSCGGWGIFSDGVTATGSDFSSMETYRVNLQGNYAGGVYINGGNDNRLRFLVNNVGTCVTPSGTFTNPTPGPSVQLEGQLSTHLWCHLENNNSGEGLVIGRNVLCYSVRFEGLFYNIPHPVRLDKINGAKSGHSIYLGVPVGNYCIESTANTRYLDVDKEWYRDIASTLFLNDGNAGTVYAATGYLGVNALGLGPTNVLSAGLTSTSGETIGYGTGSGSAVFQATSKSTAVGPLDKVTGRITVSSSALAAGATATFSVTCNKVAQGDCVIVNPTSGAADLSAYSVRCVQAGTGLFKIGITNTTAGSLSEAFVLQYCIIKGAAS